MGYLMDTIFPFGLENYLLDEEEINDKGLKIIAQIETETITDNSEKLKKFFNTINSKCEGKHLWALFGSNDAKKWLPLQLASVYAEEKDIRYEIKSDFKKMIPFNPKTDVRAWTSKFHDRIMEVEIGRDIQCQKYTKLREKSAYLAVAILTVEEYTDTDNSIITKYQKKEIDLAYELKPLIWNPSPQEMKYINNSNKYTIK
ncbi:MAG: hypothetical protein IKI94_05505 [Ruminococcus sp.]|nr:hypothetical protein [Ruminococcus sp.]